MTRERAVAPEQHSPWGHALAVVVVTLTAVTFLATGGDTEATGEQAGVGSSSACAVALRLDGQLYYGHTSDRKVSGSLTDMTATFPDCEDTNHHVPVTSKPVQISVAPGIDESLAFVVPSYDSEVVFVKQGLSDKRTQTLVEKAVDR